MTDNFFLRMHSLTTPRLLLLPARGPADGTVEIGYGIVPEARRRGYTSEAVAELMRWAFEHDSVERVIAHTLVGLTPSIGVLERAHFRFVGAGTDPSEPEAIQYEMTRAEWQARKVGDTEVLPSAR